MDAETQKRLEEDGWVFGDTQSFLGLSDAEIASRLGQSVVDVQAAVGRVVERLHLRSRSELALLAVDDPGNRTRWTPRAG